MPSMPQPLMQPQGEEGQNPRSGPAAPVADAPAADPTQPPGLTSLAVITGTGEAATAGSIFNQTKSLPQAHPQRWSGSLSTPSLWSSASMNS